MSNWITVGRSADPALPPDRLTPAELAELHRLLAARGGARGGRPATTCGSSR